MQPDVVEAVQSRAAQKAVRTIQGQHVLSLAALPLLFCLMPTIALADICSRTVQVRDAIIAKVADKTDCAEITDTDLAGITGTLALNGQSITSLKATDFDGLTGLTFLNLGSNGLGSLPMGIFDGLGNLTRLELQYNSLSSLPADVFDELDSLSRLNLYDNGLSSLPEDIFDELATLTILNLGGNNLGNLPAGVFDGLTGLDTLALHENRSLVASSLDDVFDKLTKLTQLRLAASNLTTLPTGVFDQLTSLTRLFLGANKFSSLPAGIFDQLTGLTYLELHQNNLGSLRMGVFDKLTGLTTLILAYNNLSGLPTGIFDQLTGLRVLFLSNNKLDSLDENVFAKLSALSMLRLENNGFVTLPSKVFASLNILGHLNLSGNSSLKCLPELPGSLFNLILDKDRSAYAACDAVMLLSSSTQAASATLTILNHSDAWWYKRTLPDDDDTCHSVDAGTETASLSGLSANTDHTYKAYGNKGCMTEITDNLTDTDFLTRPGKPTKPDVSSGEGAGKLTLKASVTGDGTLTGWQYQQKAASDPNYGDWTDISSTSTSLSHQLSCLSSVTGYRFKVRAVNATGTGVVSDASDAAQPSSATLTASTVTRHSATLTIASHADAWWYKRTVPNDDGTCHSVATGTATASLSGLSANTNYTYKAYCDSSCSTEISNDTTDADFLTKRRRVPDPVGAPPEMPDSVTVTRVDGALIATWTAVEDATSYQVIYIVDGETESSLAAENHPDNSITITGVDNARTYTVGIRARNEHGDSDFRYSRPAGPFAPATVSIGDVAVLEEDGMARLTVTVEGTPLNAFRVRWSTADDSALQGRDYVSGRGVIELGRGNGWRATIEVQLIDDTVNEGKETFLVRLGEPTEVPDVVLARGTATVTITDNDPMPKAWLARYGRTVAGQMVDAVTERLEGGSSGEGGLQVTLGGRRMETAAKPAVPGLNGMRPVLRDAEEKTMTAREFLLGSTFHVASRNPATGRSFTAWGRAAVGDFDGTTNGVAVNGEVVTAILGTDVGGGGARWIAGLALSHSTGNGSFTPSEGDDGAGGKMESVLPGVWPYVQLTLNDRVTAWGLLGHGEGTLTLTEKDRAAIDTDLSMSMGAAGGRGVLATAPENGGFELALKADALMVRTASERAGGMEQAEADVSRIRLLLDASRPFEFGDATLIPRTELGLRLDRGDAETGMGVEIRAGVSYVGDGVSVEGFVRGLVAHEQTGYEEWGAGLSVGIKPGADGRGLSLSLAPAWGETAGEMERMWSAGSWSPGPGRSPGATHRLDALVGYGFGVPGGPGVVTLWAGLGLAQDRSWRAGLRWQLAPGALLSLDGTRRESAGDNAPDHELMLRFKVRW